MPKDKMPSFWVNSDHLRVDPRERLSYTWKEPENRAKLDRGIATRIANSRISGKRLKQSQWASKHMKEVWADPERREIMLERTKRTKLYKKLVKERGKDQVDADLRSMRSKPT